MGRTYLKENHDCYREESWGADRSEGRVEEGWSRDGVGVEAAQLEHLVFATIAYPFWPSLSSTNLSRGDRQSHAIPKRGSFSRSLRLNNKFSCCHESWHPDHLSARRARLSNVLLW